MTQLIESAKSRLSQSLVFDFAESWMHSYEQGFGNSDCTYHALQATGMALCVPEHREVARRAIQLIINAGFGIN